MSSNLPSNRFGSWCFVLMFSMLSIAPMRTQAPKLSGKSDPQSIPKVEIKGEWVCINDHPCLAIVSRVGTYVQNTKTKWKKLAYSANDPAVFSSVREVRLCPAKGWASTLPALKTAQANMCRLDCFEVCTLKAHGWNLTIAYPRPDEVLEVFSSSGCKYFSPYGQVSPDLGLKGTTTGSSLIAKIGFIARAPSSDLTPQQPFMGDHDDELVLKFQSLTGSSLSVTGILEIGDTTDVQASHLKWRSCVE